MVSINSLRQGSTFKLDNHLYQVLSYNHIKMGRGGAIIKVKLKDLHTGSNIEKSFKNTDSVEDIMIENCQGQYLYRDTDKSYFMDTKNFEQYEVENKIIGESLKFLKEGQVVTILKHDNKVLNITLPIKDVYFVTEAPPGIKGDTVSGGSKIVQIETGASIVAPLFIKVGDKIKINTQEGTYVERV